MYILVGQLLLLLFKLFIHIRIDSFQRKQIGADNSQIDKVSKQQRLKKDLFKPFWATWKLNLRSFTKELFFNTMHEDLKGNIPPHLCYQL